MESCVRSSCRIDHTELRNGVIMPLFGLGTYKITGRDVINNVLDMAFEAGYRMIGCPLVEFTLFPISYGCLSQILDWVEIEFQSLKSNLRSSGKGSCPTADKPTNLNTIVHTILQYIDTCWNIPTTSSSDAIQLQLKAELPKYFNLKRSLTSILTTDANTASVYRNESDIGAVLPRLLEKHSLQRSDIFVTSKLAPGDHGSGKCRDACLSSLKRLGLDYLDLYLIHWPGVQGMKHDDARMSQLRQESWSDLEQLHKEGLLRAVGVSNYTQHHLQEMFQYCSVKPAVLQVEFHPHLRQSELRQFCIDNGIFLQAYSSLGTSTSDNKLLKDTKVVKIANECGRTSAEVLLRWAVQQSIGVVPKSTSRDHILMNIQVFKFSLSEPQMMVLNNLHANVHYCWNPTDIL